MTAPTAEHKDSPEADLVGLWIGSLLIFTSFSFLGLMAGVIFAFGPAHFLTRTLGLAIGGIFYYSHFAQFLNSVLPDGFSNSWFGVQDFETLHNLGQLLPFLAGGSTLGLILAVMFSQVARSSFP